MAIVERCARCGNEFSTINGSFCSRACRRGHRRELFRTETESRFAGATFGRLTLLRTVVRATPDTVDDREPLFWECACACGATVVRRWKYIRTGETTSCGCVHAAQMSAFGSRGKTHGRTARRARPALYVIWGSLKKRCLCPTSRDYKDYGGRGIKVCERWLHSFADFEADMGPRPSLAHSIDRYPNKDGDYEPGNCRWATLTEQGRNKRNNHMVTIDNETLCFSEWAERFGISADVAWTRVSRGWSERAALTTPLRQRPRRRALPDSTPPEAA